MDNTIPNQDPKSQILDQAANPENKTTILPKVLKSSLNQQFGTKAPEKLKRLLFMLRENKDVFNTFSNNLVDILYDNKNLELIDGLVHLMMKDLTYS